MSTEKAKITTKPSARATALDGDEPEHNHETDDESIEAPRISDDELLAELQRLTVELEKVVTAREIDEHSKFAANTYFRRFESLTDARAKAGVDALGVAIMLDEICPHSVEERTNGPDVALDLDWDRPGIGPDKRGT